MLKIAIVNVHFVFQVSLLLSIQEYTSIRSDLEAERFLQSRSKVTLLYITKLGKNTEGTTNRASKSEHTGKCLIHQQEWFQTSIIVSIRGVLLGVRNITTNISASMLKTPMADTTPMTFIFGNQAVHFPASRFLQIALGYPYSY